MTAVFVLVFVFWRVFIWRINTIDKITLNSFPMRSSSIGEENIGYSALENKLDERKDRNWTDTVTVNEISASASQNSLSKFMKNRNTSKVSIEPGNVFVNYSVLLNELKRTLRLNLISVENLRCTDLKGLDNLSVYVRIQLIYVGECE